MVLGTFIAFVLVPVGTGSLSFGAFAVGSGGSCAWFLAGVLGCVA